VIAIASEDVALNANHSVIARENFALLPHRLAIFFLCIVLFQRTKDLRIEVSVFDKIKFH